MSAASGRLAIGFSCIGHFLMHALAGLYLTVVLALQRDWSMSYDELIRLWTLGSLLIGLGAPLAGWLGDRWSESRMMVVFFLVTGGGSIAAGLAGGATALMLGLALLGLGASIYHPVGMSWLVRHATNRGRAMGILGIFGSAGVGCAAVIAGTLTDWIDWRAAFIIPGAVCLAAGLALWACIALGLVADRKDDARPEPLPARGDAIRAFIVLSVTMICAGLIFNGMQVAMPKWFELRMTGLTGGDVAAVGGLVTAVYLLAALAQLAGGALADRFPLKLVYLAGMVVQVPVVALAAELGGLPLLLAVSAAVFMGGFLLPAENLLLARYTPNRHRGLAYGLKFILAFGAAPVSVQLVAWSYGTTGAFTLLLWVLAGLAILSLLAAALLPGEGRRAMAPAGAAAE